MHRGYIKLWRKIEDWDWHNDLQTLGFFVHLLKKANHKTSNFMGFEIPRGSLICGRKQLAAQFNIGERVVRTMLTRLKSTNDIAIKTTNKFSIIRIVNYELYQAEPTSKKTSKSTNERPATDQQPTTSKECKNVKNEKNYDENLLSKPEGRKAFQELTRKLAREKGIS